MGDSEKRCYVMDMDKDLKDQYEKLNDDVEVLKKVMPSGDIYTKKAYNLFAGGSVDASSARKKAAEVCANFDIVTGVQTQEKDVNKFAIDQLKKSMASPLYDLEMRDIYACDNKAMQYAMSELKRCGGDMNKFKAICTFRRSSCVYIVSCPYD